MKTFLWKALCLFMFPLTMRFGHRSHWTYSLFTPLWTFLMCCWSWCFKISFPQRWQITFVTVMFLALQLYLRCFARYWIVKGIPQSWHSFRFFKWTVSRCNLRYFLSTDLPKSGHFSRVLKWTLLVCWLRRFLENTLSQYSHLAVWTFFCAVGESFKDAS